MSTTPTTPVKLECQICTLSAEGMTPVGRRAAFPPAAAVATMGGSMYQRLRRKPSRPPAPLPAELVAEFRDREWWGASGGFTTGPAEPQPAAQLQLGLPAPDWAAEEQERREREGAEPVQPLKPLGSAVSEMMQRALELGEVDEAPAFALPLQLAPLPRFVGEPVDWRAEEQQALQRNQAAELAHARALLGLEEAPKPTYPARRTPLAVEPVPEQPASGLRLRLPAPPWAEGAA